MFRKILSSRCAAALAAAFLCLAPGAALAQPAYPVTTTDPTGVGSLSQAVADLNASGQPGLVSFAPGSAGTISLSGGLTLTQTASFVNASGGDVTVTLSGATNVTTLTASSLGTMDGANVISFSAQSTGDNATAIASAGSLAIDAFGYNGNATAEAGGDGAFGIRGDTGLSIGSMDGVVSAQAAGDGAFGLSSGGSVSIGSWSQGAVMAVAGGSNASGVSAGGDLTLGTMSYGQIMATTLGSDACGLSAAGDIAIGTMTDTLIVAQAGTGDAYGIVSQGNLTITTLGEGIIYALTPGDRAYALSAVGDVSIGRLEGAVVGVAQGDDAVAILGNGAVTIGTLAESGLVGASADTGAIAIDAMNGDITVDALQGMVMAIAESGEAVGLRTDTGYNVVIGGMSSDGYIQVVSDVGSAFGIASGGDVVLGGLSGTVDVFSGGNTAVGIQAQGGIHGAGGGSAILSGAVSAEAEGIAVAVASGGPMDLYVTGLLSGVDTSGGGQGYAIRAGVSDGAGGWTPGSADNVVTLGTGAALQGTVDLGTGDNTLALAGTGAVDTLFLGVTHLVAVDGPTPTSWNLSLTAPNASSFSDLTVQSQATLRINENVTITGNTVTDGALIIDLGADKTYGGDISGSGSLIKDGDAVLTLSGSNTYTGGTAVMEGLLRVTGALDSSQYHIFSGAAFETWQDVTLHRTSLVNGALTAPLVTVAADGVLMGSGTIHGDVVNGGVLSPGNSPGDIFINGNLTLLSGGSLLMDITPTGSDRVLVTGLTTLGGALDISLEQGFYRQGQRYTLISSAGGVTGDFTSIATPGGSPFLFFTLDRTATDVTATVNRLPYTIAAGSGNAAAAGRGLTGATRAATPSMQQLLGGVDFMSQAEVAQGLQQMSPEPYSALVETSFSAMRLFSDTIRDRAYAQRRGGETPLSAFSGGDLGRLPQLASAGGLGDAGGPGIGALPATGDGFGLFVKPVGQYQSYENGLNRTGFQSWQYGVMAGGDARITEEFLAGFQVGYVHSDLRFRDEATSTGVSDAFLGGLFASFASGGLYLDGLIQAGAAVNRLDRKIAFGGVSREPTGKYASFLFGASLSTGFEWTFGRFRAGPVATLDYGYVNTPGFAESDPDLGLTVGGFSGNSLQSGLGAKVTGVFAISETTSLTPDLSLRWGHEFLNGSRNIQARFNGSPTSSFTAATGDPARDSFLVDAGVSLGVAASTKIFVRYSGQLLGEGTQTQAGAVGVRYEF